MQIVDKVVEKLWRYVDKFDFGENNQKNRKKLCKSA